MEEAEQIPTNLGNPFIKVNRIHGDAKSWMEQNKDLLQRCGIQLGIPAEVGSKKPVSIDEVNGAIESAAKELSVDLDEIKKLKEMAAQSQDWFDLALEYAPKRNKRIVGSKKDTQEKCTMQKVISLIESASNIPMDTSEDVERLGLLLSDVQSWRLEAQVKLKEVAATLIVLGDERVENYGKPDQFLEASVHDSMDVEDEKDDAIDGTRNDMNAETKDDDATSNISTAVKANAQDVPQDASDSNKSENGADVYKMVENLAKSFGSVSILTLEEEIIKHLEVMMRWCKKGAGIIDSHEDVFTGKRSKKDLDALINESAKLYLDGAIFSLPLPEDGSEEKAILSALEKSVADFISDDMKRLQILQTQRDNYYSWCQKANEAYVESDKRVPVETLQSLAEECSIYPSSKFTAYV